MIKVSMLNCEQQKEELAADRKAYMEMLEKLTGTSLEGQELTIPDENAGMALSGEICRPEIAMYDAQLLQNEAQTRQLDSKISPKFNLSIQGGIGRPGLNILENSFQPYYTAGIKMSWDIGALYTRKDEKRKLDARKRTIESDRETFLFNTGLNAMQLRSAIDKARGLLERDREIKEKTERMLDMLEMKDAGGRFAAELPLGWKQKLSLLHSPRTLPADNIS